MNNINNGKLSVKTKLGFGVCDVGGNLFFTVVAFQMASYLTDTVGLSAGLMGIALLIGRIVDAVTDPLMGFVSDRTRTKWGRRRPFIFGGAFPLFIFMVLMFSTPDLASQKSLFMYVTIVFCFLSASYTIVNIPYGALTPELTDDFHEQTSLNGFRMSFAVIGTLIGAGAALPIINSFANERTGYTAMGIVFGGVMFISAMITFFSVKEPKLSDERSVKGNSNIFKEYLAAFKNKPFLLILFPWAFFITGVTVISSMLKYYFEYVLEEPDGVTIALLVLLLCSLLCIPLWVKISKKIGKKLSYMIGMTIVALFCLFFAFGAEGLGKVQLYIAMMIGGFGLSTHYVLPYSLIPDAVEWDYFRTGKKREGIYYGLWTFISKLGQGISAIIVGFILSSTGYQANIIQEASAIFGIKLLTGPVACLVIIIGTIILGFYPISEKVYNEMKAKHNQNVQG